MTVPARPAPGKRTLLGVSLVLGGYAIPLVLAVILLYIYVDPTVAIGLAVVECSTILGIRFAMRAPDPRARAGRLPGDPVLGLPGDEPRGNTARDFTKVAIGMVGIVLVLGVVAVIASHAG